MTDPRETRTNAADSAPGVDDGRYRAGKTPVNAKPGGRPLVFWLVGLALIILVVVFIARPNQSRSGSDEMVEVGGTRAEIAASQAPGAQSSGSRTEAPTP